MKVIAKPWNPKFRCNLCVLRQHNNASKKIDSLWLRTIRGRDYLVCQIHRGHHESNNQIRERYISGVPTISAGTN